MDKRKSPTAQAAGAIFLPAGGETDDRLNDRPPQRKTATTGDGIDSTQQQGYVLTLINEEGAMY